MKNIKAVIFDIGDTIEPSTKIEKGAVEDVEKKYCLGRSFTKTFLEADKYHEPHMFHAQGEKKIMKITLKKLKLNLDYNSLTKDMNHFFWIRLKQYYKKDKFGREFVKTVGFLKKNGFKVAIMSDNSFSSKKPYSTTWKSVGVKFDAFIVSEEVGFEKPSKRIFDETLNIMKLKPENIVYLGNNLKRDAAATIYGWNFIWVYGFSKADKATFSGKKIKFITLRGVKTYLKSQEMI